MEGKIELRMSDLIADKKENGLNNKQMAEKYGISTGQVIKALKEAGIKQRPIHKTYTLINDLIPKQPTLFSEPEQLPQE